MPLAFCVGDETACDEGGGATGANGGDSALIVQQADGKLYKWLNGTQGYLGWWQGPAFPNASSRMPSHADVGTCVGGCLFELTADAGERVDLRATEPDLFAKLAARMREIGASVFQTDHTGGYDNCTSTAASYAEHRGFLAPRCFAGPAPPPPPALPPPPLSAVRYQGHCLVRPADGPDGSAWLPPPILGDCGAKAAARWGLAPAPGGAHYLSFYPDTGAQLYLKMNESGGVNATGACARGELFLNPSEAQAGPTLQGFVFDRGAKNLASSLCVGKCLGAGVPPAVALVDCDAPAAATPWTMSA